MRLRARYTWRSSSSPARSVLGHEDLHERGHQLAGRRARARRASTGTSRQPSTAKPSSASTFATASRGRRRRRSTGRNAMPVAYAPDRRQLEVGTTARKNASGIWTRMPGAVAGVGLGAGRAAVVQAAHRGERLRRRSRGSCGPSCRRRSRRRTRRARSGGRRARGKIRVRVRRARSRSVTWCRPRFGRSAPLGSGRRGTTLARGGAQRF